MKIMKAQQDKREIFYPHVSVDCVLLGISNDKLTVLLVERKDQKGGLIGFKLPGSLIYETEDLDTAANRVLRETTGHKRVPLKQFRSFGSPTRTQNIEDVQWLENASNMKIDRIVTIAYLALCRNNKRSHPIHHYDSAKWTPIDELPRLPFDHLEIIKAAVEEIRLWVEKEPAILFDYLPAKFTASELRRTYEVIFNKGMDVRNFHKKMNSMKYIISTNDMEDGVRHRAARYYRFDKVIYNRLRS